MPLVEKMWAIKHLPLRCGWEGFYYGTFPTRKDAIEDHIKHIGGTWKQHYRRGDRAVKVIISEVSP